MIPLYDRNPTRTFPFFTLLIIGANIAAFVYQVSLPAHASQVLVERMGVVPAAWTGQAAVQPGIATFFTCMFLHGSILHLGGNMLFLWVFGNNIEDALGHIMFVVFYVLAGIAASLTHVMFNLDSALPVIGASGAVSGVLGAYFLYYPRARVVGILPPFVLLTFEVPAFVFLGFYLALQVVSAVWLTSPHMVGVAWWAHIGGFAAGFVLALILPRRR